MGILKREGNMLLLEMDIMEYVKLKRLEKFIATKHPKLVEDFNRYVGECIEKIRMKERGFFENIWFNVRHDLAPKRIKRRLRRWRRKIDNWMYSVGLSNSYWREPPKTRGKHGDCSV